MSKCHVVCNQVLLRILAESYLLTTMSRGSWRKTIMIWCGLQGAWNLSLSVRDFLNYTVIRVKTFLLGQSFIADLLTQRNSFLESQFKVSLQRPFIVSPYIYFCFKYILFRYVWCSERCQSLFGCFIPKLNKYGGPILRQQSAVAHWNYELIYFGSMQAHILQINYLDQLIRLGPLLFSSNHVHTSWSTWTAPSQTGLKNTAKQNNAEHGNL